MALVHSVYPIDFRRGKAQEIGEFAEKPPPHEYQEFYPRTGNLFAMRALLRLIFTQIMC